MKQVNDATKIIQELLDRGKTIGEIADYMAVERRTVLHWKQGYRIIWGGRIGPKGPAKNPTGPSNNSMMNLKHLLEVVKGNHK